MEFKSWLTDVLHDTGDATRADDQPQETVVQYETVLDEKTLDVWLQRLREATLFAFDTETTSLDYMQAEVVDAIFEYYEHRGFELSAEEQEIQLRL